VLVLQISTNLGEISDSFSIAVGSPKDLLTSELSEKESLLKEVGNSLYSLNAFERAQVTKVVDLDALKANLSQFKDEAQGAVSDEDYHHIISNFLSLDFPVSVEKVPVKKSFFVSNSNDFDLDALSEVTGLDYNSTTATYDYIEFWEINNLDVDYSLDKILINWEDGSDSTVNLFDFSIDFKGKTKEDYYFFVKDGVDFDFGDVENVKEIEGYKYFVSPTGTLVFATSELVNLKDYFFIAPKKVELQNGFEVEEARVNYWVFVFGFVFVVLVGFGIYFFVHWWYDKKYEGFLFPDKNQLYNAMVYITNSVSEGASEDEIRKNLLGVGWKREQVSYLLKKYAGRRTGIVNLFGFGKKTGYSGNTPPKPGRNADFSGDYPKFNK